MGEIVSSSKDTVEESKEIEAKDKSIKSPEQKIDPLRADKDLRVRNLLATCLSDQILRKVMHETTALGMWKALERDYQTKTLPNMIYLKQHFANFKMEEVRSIEENLDAFLKLVADLASLNINVNEEDQAIQILTSLPPLYEPLVHTLKYGTGKDILTVREVTEAAYAKEVKLRQKNLINKSKGSASGLFVGTKGRSQQRNDRQWRGISHSKGRSKSRPKNSKGCWICGKEGHLKKNFHEKKEMRVKPGLWNLLMLLYSSQDQLCLVQRLIRKIHLL